MNDRDKDKARVLSYMFGFIALGLMLVYFLSCAAPQRQPHPRCAEWRQEVDELENRIETEPNEEWRTRLIENHQAAVRRLEEHRCP